MKAAEIAAQTIKARINGDKAHGWGKEDSLAVIRAIYENEVGEQLPDEASQAMAEVINPSAFRQKLEAANMLVEDGKKKRLKSILDGIA